MSGKIEIAIWEDKIITAQEYSKGVHKKVYCPFCNPPVQIYCVLNSFFRAMPNVGGHNCGKVSPIYLDADWEGQRLVEKIRDSTGNLNVIIDINNMKYTINTDTKDDNKNTEELNFKHGKEGYYTYNEYKKVFRDVIRTVIQMKHLIAENTQEQLSMLIFKFKIDKEELRITDVLKLPYELNKSLSGKSRFVIFKAESVIKSKTKNEIYVNAYGINENFVVASLRYPGDIKQIGIKKDDYVLGFGKIVYSGKLGKYFLNIASDANIQKLKEDDAGAYFDGRTLESYKSINVSNKINHITEVKLQSIDVKVAKEKFSNNNTESEKNNYNPIEHKNDSNSETQDNKIIDQTTTLLSKKRKNSFFKKIITKISLLLEK